MKNFKKQSLKLFALLVLLTLSFSCENDDELNESVTFTHSINKIDDNNYEVTFNISEMNQSSGRVNLSYFKNNLGNKINQNISEIAEITSIGNQISEVGNQSIISFSDSTVVVNISFVDQSSERNVSQLLGFLESARDTEQYSSNAGDLNSYYTLNF